MASQVAWETVKVDSDYEICTEYPYHIRRKSNNRVVSEYKSDKYIRVTMNGKQFSKHVIVAIQWVENEDPENLVLVYHHNRDTTDNHVSNLRWASTDMNARNRESIGDIKYEFFDSIPDDSIAFSTYETRNGTRYLGWRYFYDRNNVYDDVFYIRIDDDLYRRLHVHVLRNGKKVVYCKDTDERNVTVYINEFKRQYDI